MGPKCCSLIGYCLYKLPSLLISARNSKGQNSAKSVASAAQLNVLLRLLNQGHPTDRFGGISVQKTCNRLKFSVREMSSRAFLINFGEIKVTFWAQK